MSHMSTNGSLDSCVVHGDGSDSETFLFTSESVGEGHPGMDKDTYTIVTVIQPMFCLFSFGVSGIKPAVRLCRKFPLQMLR